jgi:hypothetical protein
MTTLHDDLRGLIEVKTARADNLPNPGASAEIKAFANAVSAILARHEMSPAMREAIAAGDGTLHGAIDYWQQRALAAEARHPEAEPVAWRPISSAPKDGTDILVDAPDVVCGCTIVHWKAPGWRLTFDGKLFNAAATQPKFWMPLHAPPAQRKE